MGAWCLFQGKIAQTMYEDLWWNEVEIKDLHEKNILTNMSFKKGGEGEDT